MNSATRLHRWNSLVDSLAAEEGRSERSHVGETPSSKTARLTFSALVFRERDRRFESPFLQRGVRSELLPVEVWHDFDLRPRWSGRSPFAME